MRLKSKPTAVWQWLLPFLIYSLHSLLFMGWIIDDAGISFAYARNLADGYGLVSQPGLAPVEGFSNFLWVVLLTPFFAANLFHPTITPKLLSALLILVAFVLIDRALRLQGGQSKMLTFVVLCPLAICTPFVVWTASGLENALLVFLLSQALVLSLRYAQSPERNRIAGRLGLVCAAVAMTRPDGVVYAGIFPILAAIVERNPSISRNRSSLRYSLVGYFVNFLLAVLGFLLFRRLYFGEWLPNTYYAKDGPELADLIPPLTLQPQPLIRAVELISGVAGILGGLLAVSLLTMTVWLIARKRFNHNLLVWSIYLGFSLLIYLLLPPDWMSEFRFATPFFLFLYGYAVLATNELVGELNFPERGQRLFRRVAVLLALGLSLSLFVGRSIAFSVSPTVPFEDVAEKTRRFNNWADELNLSDLSILTPDIGGALYYSRLRVYDLGGLCDRTIARTRGQHQEAFYDYVFDVARPSFIHTHQVWTLHSRFEYDARFERHYVPIFQTVDQWVEAATGLSLHSGVFVRREIAQDNSEKIHQFQMEMIEERVE